MAELILLHTHVVEAEGVAYAASVYGEVLVNGNWNGWLEFHPLSGSARILRTGRETTQANRDALEQWANGLGPMYLEAALDRARGATIARDALH